MSQLPCLLTLAAAFGGTQAQPYVPLTDGPGGMTCYFYSASGHLAWATRGGDWVDRTGARHGDTPFSSRSVQSAKARQVVTIDVTELVRAWDRAAVPGSVFLRSTGGPKGGIVNFLTREHVETDARPRLSLTWADGRRTRVEASADTHFSCPTHTSLGRRQVLQIGRGYDAVLVFPYQARPDQRIVSAELTLTTEKQYGGGTTVGAFLPAPPFGDSPPTPGLAAGYPLDAGIEKHPDVLFSERFERADWKRAWSDISPSSDASPVTSDTSANRFDPFDGKALKTTIREGKLLGLSMHFRFAANTGSEPEEVYFRYYLRFADNWNPTVTGGKMPGLAGTYERAGWGGRSSDGTNGWSARGAFFKQETRDPAFERLRGIGSYLYLPEGATGYGDPVGWNLGPTGMLEKNRWYSVEQYVRLNRPGSADGVLRAWIDGQLAYERTEIRFRDVPDLKIETVWMNVYHGGMDKASQDLSVYFDNIVVARRYIGPAGQRR